MTGTFKKFVWLAVSPDRVEFFNFLLERPATGTAMVLTPSQLRGFYDRFGDKQHWQAFYEDAALDELAAHAAFERARSVFELGCGTGRFAARLLSEHLPSSASYLGADLSTTMTSIAKRRLAGYKERADIVQTDGSMRFPLPDRSVDRVVSTYVFDLLSDTVIKQAITETRRVLAPDGRLCLASLTRGTTPVSRIVSLAWGALFRIRAQWVGGCRPIRLEPFLDPREWSQEYSNVVVAFGVPSEVLVATMRHASSRTV